LSKAPWISIKVPIVGKGEIKMGNTAGKISETSSQLDCTIAVHICMCLRIIFEISIHMLQIPFAQRF